MAKPTRFWDFIAKRYARTPVSDEESYQKKLQVTRDYFRPDMEVLEFGCGTGSTAIAHAPYVHHIRAIDFSAKMIAIAKDKATATNVENVTFEQASIDDLTAPDQTYDAIMGHSILHLLENRQHVIAKVHKLLKPGGVFVSSTICIGDGYRLLQALHPIGHFVGLLPVLKFFTEQELTRDLTGAGFEIDYQWNPGEGRVVFIVAKRVG
jgi:ubiquinone/menaquinone biosynthesis C-methylase UbiE